MKLIKVVLIIVHFAVTFANYEPGKEYVFKVTDQQFSAINIRGRVIPPVDTVFEGELHIRALPNNTYYGQFRNTLHYGNVQNKGNLGSLFLVEVTEEQQIDNIQVSKEWEKKGVRYVYDVMKELLRPYSTLTSLNDSVESVSVHLPLGLCNATVNVVKSDNEKVIEAKCDKSKCELDQELLEIIGDDGGELLTEDTFNEVKISYAENEPFAKLEVTMNIRGEDPLKEFLVAIVSNTQFDFVQSEPNEEQLTLEDGLVKHGRKEILGY